MRIWVVIPMIALVGCAGHRPAATTPQEPMKVDETNVVKAQRMGYRVIDENGRRLFCRRDTVTGSYLTQRTMCLTETQWEQEADAARQAVDNINRVPRPRGGGG